MTVKKFIEEAFKHTHPLHTIKFTKEFTRTTDFVGFDKHRCIIIGPQETVYVDIVSTHIRNSYDMAEKRIGEERFYKYVLRTLLSKMKLDEEIQDR